MPGKFDKESDFEQALIDLLKAKGWESTVLKNYTEEQLIRNWADILFENNRGIDRLNDYPLTDSEMQQIIEQIETLKTPLRLNGFINGGSVSITQIGIIIDYYSDAVNFLRAYRFADGVSKVTFKCDWSMVVEEL